MKNSPQDPKTPGTLASPKSRLVTPSATGLQQKKGGEKDKGRENRDGKKVRLAVKKRKQHQRKQTAKKKGESRQKSNDQPGLFILRHIEAKDKKEKAR